MAKRKTKMATQMTQEKEEAEEGGLEVGEFSITLKRRLKNICI